jgi:hypothetical protein
MHCNFYLKKEVNRMCEKLSPERQKEWMDARRKEFRKCSMCGEYESSVFLFPKKIEVPVITWDMECYSCGKKTPIVWTKDVEHDEYTFSITPYSIKDLREKIAQKYPFFKVVEKLTQGITQHGNVCVHCGVYQGDWYIKEDLLEIYVGGGEFLLQKENIEVELTEEEQFERTYSKPNIRLLNRTIDKENNVKMLLCNECWKEQRKKI